MAAAEARAVWQRAANRCFVQEDAKRAPKLACCQSSSSTSKQVDSGPASTEETADHCGPSGGGFIPFPRNDSFRNLPSETRWWLQLQPGFGYQRGLDIELEILKAEMGNSKPRQETGDEGCRKCTDDGGAMMSSYGFVEMNHFGSSVSKETDEVGFDSVSEPWWRSTDKDDIASLVAKKSLDHVENCDLPPPQKVHVGGHPYSRLGCFEQHKMSEPSLDWRPQKQGIRVGCPDFGRQMGMKWASDEEEEGHRFDKGSSQKSYSSGVEEEGDRKKMIAAWEGGDPPSKAELLEALCHSQTRAREAEKAAKRANAEKEHIIKLFFRQASQLFAYKQWFQLLQLESMYLQIKDTDQSSTFLPAAFRPWTIKKGKKLQKSCNWRRGRWGKRGQVEVDVTKYAVAIALGFGLVGAGLFLGWTVGWMLPPL